MEMVSVRTVLAEEELGCVRREMHNSTLSTPSVGRARRSSMPGADYRYIIEPNQLVLGRPQDAARGINFYLKVSDGEVYEKMVYGMASVRREIADFGTDVDKECLDYILNHPAGSSDRAFANGVRDQGRNGERLIDFVKHPHSKQSGLSEAHVLALRLYTSAAYESLNNPLRDQTRSAPHPFPITINLITEGLKRLRSIGADDDDAHTTRVLWRGLKHLRVGDNFDREGGTELAPMSATAELAVAARYAVSPFSLVFKIVTKSFMERGVDLSYLSCFPEEKEHLFAPLTYLRPTGATCGVECEGMNMLVVEVEPTFGS